MAIINLSDDFFTPEERFRLSNIFGIENDDKVAFNSNIEKITKAAITEYKEMLSGKGLPTRADEIRQYRLFQLIKFYFSNRMPTEFEIANMFQLTSSESKSLLKNVKTKYRYELSAEIEATLKTVIHSVKAEKGTGNYKITINADTVLEDLNQIIAQENPQACPITRCRLTAKTYELSADSYEILKKHFNIS